ncbi:MAG: hypothetical protein A3K19_23150 [Lentisphaerae bacterium RIFOXYB12_FULL_65_16]|nr:MAG: hypothetical protein A3K18_15660 [Lentisphaerae bacterium RIFOXYA12_64_32]OGV84942.1 MAG: hypothetical protein A3K19_23150 [Lentisphaerae bacterium RIFOXYB12_FULL_65_16]
MSEKKHNSDLFSTTADLTQIHVPPLSSTSGPIPPPRRDERSHTLKISRREVLKGVVSKQRAYLEAMGVPGFENRVFELDTNEAVMGRSAECNVHLPLPNVSRVHARVYLVNEEYHVEDMNSTNGTFVNGVRISRCALRNNDLIEVGEAKMLFVEAKVRE